MSIGRRERVRRLRIRLAALRRHAAARDPGTGRSLLAVEAGRASGIQREGDRAWGLEMALKRWAPQQPVDLEERNGRGPPNKRGVRK